jgi:pimeloyl-ACP methyl ester carboxylesterase/DNA-binding CsgD family transcriptional regulator
MSDDAESASAKRFTIQLHAAAQNRRPLEALAADADGFAQAVDHLPQGLGEALRAAEAVRGGPAAMRRHSFASAACDRAGRLVAACPGFDTWLIGPDPLADAVRDLQPGQLRYSVVVDDANGRPIAIAVARSAGATGWPLDPQVRAALEAGQATFAVLAVRPSRAWSEISAACGLTGLETRITAALAEHGDLRRAATGAGVAYETAREGLAGALVKTGARRQAELIQLMTTLAIGDVSASEDGWRTFADLFDLTARQARMAWSVAGGATRAEAAKAAGVSDHAAKTGLRAVYASCGVASATDLGRLAAEVEALTALAAATDIQWSRPGATSAPLRLIRRRRGPGRIAVEDHGPPDAAPVVVFHSPTNGRHLPRRLVTELQAAGLRPISFERPGFGLTTPSAAAHPMAEAAEDLIDILDTLGLDRVRILGRGCVAARAFAWRHPERFERGVLLGPSPPHRSALRRDGLLGAVVNLTLKQPQLIEAFGNMLIRGATTANIERLTRAIIRHSPADLAALSDPDIFADHVRSTQQAAVGGVGFVRELAAVAHESGAEYPQDGRPWVILIGDQDPLHRIPDPAHIWTDLLPGARVQPILGGGRFLHVSHPRQVAAALL